MTLALWEQEEGWVSELLDELTRWSLHDFSNRWLNHLTLPWVFLVNSAILLFSGCEFRTITLQSLFEQISNFSFAIFCRIQCFGLVVRHSEKSFFWEIKFARTWNFLLDVLNKIVWQKCKSCHIIGLDSVICCLCSHFSCCCYFIFLLKIIRREKSEKTTLGCITIQHQKYFSLSSSFLSD